MDWSHAEVDLIVNDYFDMLIDELSGLPINKTEHRNLLRQMLQSRSNGSIEYKHGNISAVMVRLGLPYIKGYKPQWNYQKILEISIITFIEANKGTLELLFRTFADSTVLAFKSTDFNQIIEKPPVIDIIAEPAMRYHRKPIKINYLEREQKNASLGLQGEQLAFDYEKWRLINTGKESWADNIEWVSRNDDGAGFDILSKNHDGSDRFIEVKTTKLSKETPIYFSKNEYEFSIRNDEHYYLYRVFNFEKGPKIFSVNGSFDEFCVKEAVSYKGYF